MSDLRTRSKEHIAGTEITAPIEEVWALLEEIDKLRAFCRKVSGSEFGSGRDAERLFDLMQEAYALHCDHDTSAPPRRALPSGTRIQTPAETADDKWYGTGQSFPYKDPYWGS